ncbi:MAG: ATP-binding cassette domain-containing protein [Chryseolinea sp.]
MMNTLEMDGIYLEYGLSRILSSVFVKCKTGQIVGILGRNGYGKSSLLKIVFGSLAAQSKSVRINGESLFVPFSKNISYLPQDNLIPSYITIRNALKLFNVDKQLIVDVFPEAKDHIDLKPSQISGGMLRIIEVLLILNSPSMFSLLDEPFSGIMPVHVDTLKEYMTTKKKEKGIIITDHLYRHVLEISDTLYVLANGKTYIVKNESQLISLGYVNSL